MENQSSARIKEIKKYLNPENHSLERISHASKPLKFSQGSFEKKILNSLKQSNRSDSLIEKFVFKDELRSLARNTEDVKSLPEKILNLTPFRSYESCHVLVHEKGKPIGQNYLSTNGGYLETKNITIQNFNNLFNLVKKSKNKIFNQTNLTKDDLSIVGNFLAKEIDLKTHSIIYLISKNSFLPPTPEEITTFQNVAFYLLPVLHKILDREKNDLKQKILEKSIESFPEKILIKKNNQTIFNNETEVCSLEKSHMMVFPIDSTENITMELSNLSKETISTEIYHSQRISLLGELLNTLQHELSNPLFGLKLTSSLLASDSDNLELKETLTDIGLNAERSQTIIKNFSNLYHDHQLAKKINLLKFIEEIITITKSETKEIFKKIVLVHFGPNEEIFVETNPTYLTQIIFNLIINAGQAIKGLGDNIRNHSIIIELKKTGDTVSISVIDDGPGVKSEHIKTIFDPFFTTKESGTGLGLSICQNLAKQIGTKVNFKNNSPSNGATFSINLDLV